jgi:hypothetical protein
VWATGVAGRVEGHLGAVGELSTPIFVGKIKENLFLKRENLLATKNETNKIFKLFLN